MCKDRFIPERVNELLMITSLKVDYLQAAHIPDGLNFIIICITKHH